MEKIASARMFGGSHNVFRHNSELLDVDMEFATFIPEGEGPFPVLYFLSGLTCTWENAATKAGAQQFASKYGVILVFPDTSPRGDDVADDASYALGKGAGFYMTATKEPWAKHYRMDSYIIQELMALVPMIAPVVKGKAGITGHSMGGHGALTLAMKNPDLFQSVSAFAPIVAPTKVPWGRDIFQAYLGEDESQWASFDACQLLASHGWNSDILVDFGDADPFLEEQLKPDLLQSASQNTGVPIKMRLQAGYDHSYYFIASFIEEHIAWHKSRHIG